MDNPNIKARLVVYGHNSCGLAHLLAKALAEHQIDHEWRDIDEGDPRFRDELRQLARGYLSVPTVIFPDGTVLVEPFPDEVLAKLQPSGPGNATQFIRQLFQPKPKDK
jgi:mycoredoxin